MTLVLAFKLKSDHLGTGFPELLSKLIISGLWIRWPLNLTVGQVLPGHSLHLLTDSTVDGGLGSLEWSFPEKECRVVQKLLQTKEIIIIRTIIGYNEFNYCGYSRRLSMEATLS